MAEYFPLQFVEKYNGTWHRFTQAIDSHGYLSISPNPQRKFTPYEVTSSGSVNMAILPKLHEPKSGRCMGIALTYCEQTLSPGKGFQFPNSDGFYPFNQKSHSVKQISNFYNYQKKYGDIDTARKKIVEMGFANIYSTCDFNKTEFDTNDLQPISVAKILDQIQNSRGQLFCLIFYGRDCVSNKHNPKLKDYSTFFHVNIIQKKPNYYAFFDPSHGEAVFKTLSNLISWLDKEINSGSLQQFKKESQIKTDGTIRRYTDYILDIYT